MFRRKTCWVPVWLLFAGASWAAPTFGDLAVLLAKGYFKESVPADAPLEKCVSFLNEYGVYFSPFDLLDPDARVSKEDFARAVGQSTLLFLGEATLVDGRILKPNNVSTWIDYCVLNDINLSEMWASFARRVEKRSVPEVEEFFRNSGG